MKRFTLLLALLVLFCFSFSACNKNNNTDEPKSDKSKIEETAEDIYNKAVGYIDAKEYEKAYTELYRIKDNDDAAKLLNNFKVLYTTTTTTGNIIGGGITKYSYDEKGNLIKKELSCDDSWEKFEYKYDNNNNLIYELFISSYSKERITEYEYDEFNNITKEKQTDSNGDVTLETYTYTYANNVIISKKVEYSEIYNNGNNESTADPYTEEYTYDNNGNLIKEYYETDWGIYTTEYTYDEKNNLTLKVHTAPNDGTGYVKDIATYSYNDSNKLVKYESKITFGSFVEERYAEYSYDKNGNLVKEMWDGDYIIEYSDFIYLYIK